MIVRNTAHSWIPTSGQPASFIAEKSAITSDQAAESRSCRFNLGDRVRVHDYRDDQDNYNGRVIAMRINIFRNWECLIGLEDGSTRWRGTASLTKRKGKSARPAP